MIARHDAIVVGSGPNGLTAALTLLGQGKNVRILEATDTAGGGASSTALTLPGFVHDTFAAVFPLSFISPAFKSLPLQEHGLHWIFPHAPLAHPLDDGPAIIVEQDLSRTAAGLGVDGQAYTRLLAPFIRFWPRLVPSLLNPLSVPRHPLLLARFGLPGLLPATHLARALFRTPRARTLFAGLAAHSILPLNHPLSSSFALVMAASAHATSWPLVEGGAGNLGKALVSCLADRGVTVETGQLINNLDQLPLSRTVFLEQTPRQVLAMAGDRLSHQTRTAFKNWRYGPGLCKVDWALDGPIPWQDERCLRAGTVHLGGSLAEIAMAENDAWHGRIPGRPFVLLTQPSLFDPSRAPEGRHTAWAYCHVPHGAPTDMSSRIEAQMERFAPGFRDRILARHVITAPELTRLDPNFIGGDITGGVQDLRQLFLRPIPSLQPHRMPGSNIYLCSAATPPGGGVHGMCGLLAARAALNRELI